MLIYLDMCAIQRPLDDKSQFRVRLESEAVMGIISFCESGRASLVSSDALEFENGHNPHPVRRTHAFDQLAKATQIIRLSADIEQRTERFIQAGLKPLDALHLACAVAGVVDHFCTCDDRLLKRARIIHTGKPKVLSPLELATELNL